MQRYNPPSNWPAPPSGWQPPPDWQPDPNWGPAPPNHQFWVDQPLEEPHPEQRGKAVTITALILAGVALLLCWVPIVNNAVFFLGFIAVVLAVIALVITVRGRSTMRGMAIASLIVGVFSLVGVLSTQALYSSMLDGVSDAVTGSDESVSKAVETSAANTQAPTASTIAGSANQPLAVGTTSAVGKEYQVTVTSVKLDANAEVLGANRFNDAPTGQYVLVGLTVTYVGTQEGTPWIDLSETFVGTDARQYDASDCDASVDQGVMDVPTLENGGSASYQLCMDVPTAAIEGGKIFVEESMSFNAKTRVYWAIR